MKKQFPNYMRMQEWWGHILPPILLFYYTGLLRSSFSGSRIYLAICILMLLAVVTAINGYFLNDLFDIKEDQLAGKKNYVANFPMMFKVFFLPFTCAFIFLVIKLNPAHLSAPGLFVYTLVFVFTMILFLAYSAPPLRIKRSVYLSPILDALYSGPLFYLLAFLLASGDNEKNISGISPANSWLAINLILILLWGFLKGLRNYLTHLSNDKTNDEVSGTRTLATIFGIKKIQSTANLFFPAEITCLTIFILLQPVNIAALLVIAVFLVYWIIYFRKMPDKSFQFLNDLYEVWLPLVILGQIVIIHPTCWPLIVLHFLFFPYQLYKIYSLFDRIYFYTIFKWIGPLRKK